MHVNTLNELCNSFRKKKQRAQSVEKSQCQSFYCQLWDNGCKASAISGELHLSESAMQCSKCVVLNKLALEGEFP